MEAGTLLLSVPLLFERTLSAAWGQRDRGKGDRPRTRNYQGTHLMPMP